MINFVLSIATFILFFFQVLYPPSLLLFGVKPDFFLILIIFLALYSKGKRTFFWAVLLGGIKDLISFDLFGINILTFSLTSMIMTVVERRFLFLEQFRTLFIFALCISFLNATIGYIFRLIFSSVSFSIFTGLKICFLQAVLTACWSIPVIYLLKRCALKFFTSASA